MLKKIVFACVFWLNLTAFAGAVLLVQTDEFSSQTGRAQVNDAQSVLRSGLNSGIVSVAQADEFSVQVGEFNSKTGDAQDLKSGLNLEALKPRPTCIYASSPPLLYLLYALNPRKVCGVNFEWNNYERPYLSQSVLAQPVVGGFFGQGKIPNVEMILKLNPDLILANKMAREKALNVFGALNKPILFLSATDIRQYSREIIRLGAAIGEQNRAQKLAAYMDETMEFSAKIAEFTRKNKLTKKKIYYAQGSDGLATECAGSMHASLIELSGAQNVHKCQNSGVYGRVKVSFEQVLGYQPDIILIYEREFFDKIYSDPKWQLLKAVREKRAFYIPREPFSWFDRPPSFMRFLGLKWLINLAYPDALNIDIKAQTREFYDLFLGVKLSSGQIDKILGE